MTPRGARREGFSLLGIGAVACVACCAGPILALFGGLSLAGLAGWVFFGGAGFVIALAALAAYLMVQRRQRGSRDLHTEPVPVDLSRKRA